LESHAEEGTVLSKKWTASNLRGHVNRAGNGKKQLEKTVAVIQGRTLTVCGVFAKQKKKKKTQ